MSDGKKQDFAESTIMNEVNYDSTSSTNGHNDRKDFTKTYSNNVNDDKDNDSGFLEYTGSSEKKNPFLNPVVAKHYHDLYEKTQYECRGRFDPEFEWSEEEEKKVRFKLEYKVTLLACFMFVALQVDRGNLAQAVSDDMLPDLNMTTNDYNTGNTIFYLAFLCAELPSQLVSKRLGCDVWIPIQMTLCC
ncbi:unnamed protein product [Ambrosiozyma monospora]|uniref:Unnamed protein product n=1 Tax=Ambrosiozyma monospora TaxID=43982 RepID=A0ACB5TGN2_AMBMO|nr:unnamed protein product [Ambrosiozyma monospora]